MTEINLPRGAANLLGNMNVDAELNRQRREMAVSKELQWLGLEVSARMWEKALAQELEAVNSNPATSSLMYRQQSDEWRAQTDAMHELAGTTRLDFRGQIRNNLDTIEGAYRQQYLAALDQEAYPEAWGNSHAPSAVLALAFEAIAELRAELDA